MMEIAHKVTTEKLLVQYFSTVVTNMSWVADSVPFWFLFSFAWSAGGTPAELEFDD